MRRPLFWVCLCLVVLAVTHLYMGVAVRRQEILSGALGEREGETFPIRVQGRICRKEEKAGSMYFWVKLNLHSNYSESIQIRSELFGAEDQSAAVSQQIISGMQQMKTDRIRCRLSDTEGVKELKMGCEVIVEGDFGFFSESSNPGEFNSAEYYQGLGAGGEIYQATILGRGDRFDPLAEGLYRIRRYLGNRLDRVFPPKEAGVLRAMLLGDREELDPELKKLYQRGGILHILSISGLHVTLLGMGVYRLLRRLGMHRGVSAVAGGILLVLYGLMTGMSVSALRAIGMFLLRMLAELWGRTYDLLTALSVLAALMLCANPLYSLQSGFWLSFGALAGVGVILPVLEEAQKDKLGELRPGEGRLAGLVRKLGEEMTGGIRAGLSVFLATLPILLRVYYEVPVYSMLLNLLVIPAMGILVFVGFLVMLVPGTGALGLVDIALLRLFEFLCSGAEVLPYSTWNPGCPEIWQVGLYYILVGVILAALAYGRKSRNGERGNSERAWHEYRHGREFRKWILAHAGQSTLLLLLPCLLFCLPVHSGAGVAFLDVGQGDGICIRTRDGGVWLCDCGSTSRKNIGEQVLIPYLKSQGIRSIEGIFLSHGDQDHVNGILGLLESAGAEGIEIHRLFLPKLGEERCEADFQEILRAADQVKGMEIQYLEAGDVIRAEGISFLVLHPRAGEAASLDSNKSSLCLYTTLESGEAPLSLLLTGDLEEEGEGMALEELRARGIAYVDILKCAHHGSRFATSGEFLDWVDGEVSVISCGRRNRYGHPAPETLERLLQDGFQVFRTDQGGAILMKWDGKKLRVHPFLGILDKNAE